MPLHLAVADEAPYPDVEARVHRLRGPLLRELSQLASRVDAHAIVLPAPPNASQARCAELMQELICTARVPVVFARELAAFAGWAQGTRPLCALVDIDFSPAAERAVHWVERLAMVGPCELVAAHQYMSSRAAGVSAAAGLQTYASEGRVRASLERELRAFVGPLQGDLVLRSRLEPARQPHADALANMALDERADLLAFAVDVHDSRARRLATRMVGEALSRASCCVLCVPASDPRAAS